MHNFFIASVVIIIVVFSLLVIALTYGKEGFENGAKKECNKHNSLKGTSLVGVAEVETNRFPIVIETPMNWYSTQPLVGTTLGTNMGR